MLVDAEVIKTEFRTSFAEVLTLAMQGISTDNFELPLYARDGSRVELLLNATTRKDARGEVVGVVMVGQDVTGKKDIEKAQMAAATPPPHLGLLDPSPTPPLRQARARGVRREGQVHGVDVRDAHAPQRRARDAPARDGIELPPQAAVSTTSAPNSAATASLLHLPHHHLHHPTTTTTTLHHHYRYPRTR